MGDPLQEGRDDIGRGGVWVFELIPLKEVQVKKKKKRADIAALSKEQLPRLLQVKQLICPTHGFQVSHFLIGIQGPCPLVDEDELGLGFEGMEGRRTTQKGGKKP